MAEGERAVSKSSEKPLIFKYEYGSSSESSFTRSSHCAVLRDGNPRYRDLNRFWSKKGKPISFMARMAYLSPIKTTSHGIFNLSVKMLLISDAIFFVGERKVDIYSAPTIPNARPICLTEHSLIKSRALSSVSNGTSIPVSSLVTG